MDRFIKTFIRKHEFKHLKLLYDEFQINSLRYTIMNGDAPTWGGPDGSQIGYILSTCTDRNGVTFNQYNNLEDNMGPDILSYGSCKKLSPITTNAFGAGYNYQKHQLSHSIYASTILEKQTYLPTTQAHALAMGNTPQQNCMSELQKMTGIGNAFLPTIGIQVNINRDITESEITVNFPILIRGQIQVTFKGSRNSANAETFAYRDPFRPATWRPQSSGHLQTILPILQSDHQ